MFLQEKHRNKKYVEQYALIMENSKKQGRIYVVPDLGWSSQLSPICETMSLAEYILMVSWPPIPKDIQEPSHGRVFHKSFALFMW